MLTVYEVSFVLLAVCQCNGHSNCAENSSVCINCRDHTAGEKCHICGPGYFGDPKDGGKCERKYYILSLDFIIFPEAISRVVQLLEHFMYGYYKLI